MLYAAVCLTFFVIHQLSDDAMEGDA